MRRMLLGLGFWSVCSLLVEGQEITNEFIRKRVEAIVAGREVKIEGEMLYSKMLLPEFYQRRVFSRAWKKEDQQAFVSVLSKANEEGLSPSDYHYDAIIRFQKEVDTEEKKAELDMLYTDAYLLYASHFLNGKVNPETVDSEWKAIRREGNAREFLEKAIVESDVPGSLARLEPQHIGYAGLKAVLKNYQAIEAKGGWPVIASGETLKPGMMDSLRVPQLVSRLMASGNLLGEINSKFEYSAEIAQAVKEYQLENGLDADGNLGRQTLASLNTPVQARMDQIRVNMERYRWISQELGDHYVMVNIANFRMQVFKGNELTYEQTVIVGKPFRKTPVFSGKMTYLVLNPFWTVPPTILFNDILPEAKKDPGYLATKNMKVFQGQGSEAVVVDPSTIDWSKLSKNYFPYTIRQDAGPNNALGAVKFMFPNKYNVYIHDTPSKELFNRPDRAFSSGCIRLNKPMEFMKYLLKDDPQWNSEKIEKSMASGKEQTIMLMKPLNVHILYLTAWSENGRVHFRKDLYERDAAVLRALNATSPLL